MRKGRGLVRFGVAVAILVAALIGSAYPMQARSSHPRTPVRHKSASHPRTPTHHKVGSHPHGPGNHKEVPLPVRIDSYLRRLAQAGFFSGSVLVARGDTVLFNRGYGMADWRRHVADGPSTVFRIGSITKQFTALAIMQLQYWGRLHVGDHICSYIPGCPHKWHDITIYELLTHTSGMPDRFNDTDYDTTHSATPEQLLKRFAAKPLNFPPGTNYYYSNAGYAILGYIVSRVSGMSYGAYLQRYVFAPLHLYNTGIDPDPHHGQEATGYLSGNTTAPYINMSTAYAFGDIYSTAGDLFTWDRALFNGTLVPMRSLAPMFQTHVTAMGFDGSTLHYGYAWFIDEDQHHRVLSHPGLINGFASVNEYLPDDKITLVVLSNLQDASVASICHDVREMVLHG